MGLRVRFTEKEKKWLQMYISMRAMKAMGFGSDYSPVTVTKHFLSTEIKGLQPLEISGYSENLDDTIEHRTKELSNFFWTNYNIHLDHVDPLSLHTIKDQNRLAKYAKLESEAPYVVVLFDPKSEQYKVLDGRHRITVALARGEPWVMGYVGVSPHFLLSLVLRGMPKKGALPSLPKKQVLEECSGEFWDQEIMIERHEAWVRARQLKIDPAKVSSLSVEAASSLLRNLMTKKLSDFEKDQKKKIRALINKSA
jgi:hypothetical protein